MRTRVATMALLGLACSTPWPAATPLEPAAHRVVLELTSDDAQVWEGVLDNVDNVRTALGPTSVEVVAHGKGLALLSVAKNTAVRDRLGQSADDGVVFAACENTMKREQLRAGDLVPFAVIVDSGAAEVVRKQEAGWSYLRAGS